MFLISKLHNKTAGIPAYASVARFSLSNYIKILVQQEACDWTGKREAALRVAEMKRSVSEGERPRWRRKPATGCYIIKVRLLGYFV